MYYRTNKQWLQGPVIEKGDLITHKVELLLLDTIWYYANCIDYFRILLTVIAVSLIGLNSSSVSLIATLIFSSVLLDWIDGPVARYFNQSTIIGCGWDWLADLLAQYALALWCIQSDITIIVKLFVILFTIVEIATGLFDFAMSTGAVYPMQATKNLPWYLIVEDWLTPAQSYSQLGTACWLINTTFPLTLCMGLPTIIAILQAPFAFLYAWHECCQLYFILCNWFETSVIIKNV